MSIDYRANYGLGYEVHAENEEMLEDYEGDLNEYLECCADIENGIDFFEVGNAMTGNIEGIFMVVDHEWSEGLDATASKEKLDAAIKELGLITNDQFRLVGGVLVS